MSVSGEVLDFGRPLEGIGDGRPQQRSHIGIDVGGTKMEGVLIDDAGGVIASDRRESLQGEEALSRELTAMTTRLRDESEKRGLRLSGIGIGMPGRIDPHSGDVFHAVNLSIAGLRLRSGLEHSFPGIPVAVENDVNAAALGAWTVLSGGGADAAEASNLAFVNFGTGLACGIVQSGTVFHGVSGAAGEIGHLPIEAHGFACKCGQSGCLETVASGSAVSRLWPVADGYPMPDMIRRSEEGDGHAEETLDMVVQAMSLAILTVALSFDPDRIVLGGGMMKTGEALLKRIVRNLQARESGSAFIASLHLSERLSLSPPGQAIGAIGAAAVSWQQTV